MKINLNQNFTTMVTGDDNIRSYLHRFKIIETPICLCGTTDQIIDHLLFECELLNKERDSLMSTVLKTDNWPISKNKLITKHLKIFAKFTKEISFDKLNELVKPSHRAEQVKLKHVIIRVAVSKHFICIVFVFVDIIRHVVLLAVMEHTINYIKYIHT